MDDGAGGDSGNLLAGGVVNDVAGHVGDFAVGVDNRLFGRDYRVFVQDDSTGDDGAFSVEDGAGAEIEDTDVVAFDVCYDEGFVCRDNDVIDVSLDEPAVGHCWGIEFARTLVKGS